MKKVLILATLCITCFGSNAQTKTTTTDRTNNKTAKTNTVNLNTGDYSYSGYYSNDSHSYDYYGRSNSYYAPVSIVPNGFRSVSEENQLMEQMIAERRRQEKEDNSTPDEREQARRKHEDELAARKKAIEERTKPTAKAKK